MHRGTLRRPVLGRGGCGGSCGRRGRRGGSRGGDRQALRTPARQRDDADHRRCGDGRCDAKGDGRRAPAAPPRTNRRHIGDRARGNGCHHRRGRDDPFASRRAAAWATSAGAGSGSATVAASVPASARAGVVSEARAMPANARSARRARSSIAWQFRHESRWRPRFSRSSVLSSSLARAASRRVVAFRVALVGGQPAPAAR